MKRRLFIILLALSMLFSACASKEPQTPASDEPKTPAALQPTAVSTALFQVIKPDGTAFGVTVENLKALKLGQVEADGKMEEGPYLKDVLALAGVTEYKEVTLNGSSNPVTLTFVQVDDNTILDFTNHGTVKLSTTYVAKSKWTKDVSEIVVK